MLLSKVHKYQEEYTDGIKIKSTEMLKLTNNTSSPMWQSLVKRKHLRSLKNGVFFYKQATPRESGDPPAIAQDELPVYRPEQIKN